jgi:hypothetical protein
MAPTTGLFILPVLSRHGDNGGLVIASSRERFGQMDQWENGENNSETVSSERWAIFA